MTKKDLDFIQQNPSFIRLVQLKQRLTWTLTSLILFIYFGSVLLMALAPELLAISINGGVTSLGIPLIIAAILLSFSLTAVYLYQSNRKIDPINRRLLEEFYQ